MGGCKLAIFEFSRDFPFAVPGTPGAGLGATDDEAVEAEGGRLATRLVGDFVRPPKKIKQSA